MKNSTLALSFIALFLLTALNTFAKDSNMIGQMTREVKLHAGPGEKFPAVVKIAAGTKVNIHGCVEKYSWCDVSFGIKRGWAAAQTLQLKHKNKTVQQSHRWVEFGVPIVAFIIADYWNSYYDDDYFYDEIDYWDDYLWYEEPDIIIIDDDDDDIIIINDGYYHDNDGDDIIIINDGYYHDDDDDDIIIINDGHYHDDDDDIIIINDGYYHDDDDDDIIIINDGYYHDDRDDDDDDDDEPSR